MSRSSHRVDRRAVLTHAVSFFEPLEGRTYFGGNARMVPPDDCPNNNYSANPIRYFDGTLKYQVTDLSSTGMDSWGITRGWSNETAPNTGRVLTTPGLNVGTWQISQLPFISNDDGHHDVFLSTSDRRSFKDPVSAHYVPVYRGKDQLKGSTLAGLLYITEDGARYQFGPEDNNISLLQSITDPSGNVTSFNYQDWYNGSSAVVLHRLNTVTESTGSGSATVTQRYLFEYAGTPSSSIISGGGSYPESYKSLVAITLQRAMGSPAVTFNTVRKVSYDYYSATDESGFGDEGDLKTATISDANNHVVGEDYYRYWTDSTGDGFAGALKYVFTTDSFRRLDKLVKAGSSSSTAFDATDAQAAQYADYAFTYFDSDGKHAVKSETVSSAGCSCAGNNGEGTYTFTYSTNSLNLNSDFSVESTWNLWKFKTVETLPNGDQNVVYCDVQGEVLLKAFEPYVSASGAEQITAYRYNALGQVTMTVHPSAINGTLAAISTNPDSSSGAHDYWDLLLPDSGTTGNFYFVKNSSGLVELNTYGSGSSGGDAENYLKTRWVQRGDGGGTAGTTSPLKVESFTYVPHSNSDSSATIYKMASDTLYPNADGTTGLRKTSYSYDWYGTDTSSDPSDDFGVKTLTITRPVISTGQHGPGGTTADTSMTMYDSYGRPVWTKDAEGHIGYMAYDPATGALVKQITDVNTGSSYASDYSGLPSGWSNTAGLRLRMAMEVDTLGRTVKQTMFDGDDATTTGDEVTYTVYDDVFDGGINSTTDNGKAVRVYRGWIGGTTKQPTTPIEVTHDGVIMRSVLVGTTSTPTAFSYRETMTVTPSGALPVDATSGAPTGADASGGMSIDSLSRDYVNSSNQVVDSDKYLVVTPSTYSATMEFGSSTGTSPDKYRTSYWYDEEGNRAKIQTPTGTITHLVYDGQHRLVSTWIGTDDEPTSGYWSPTNTSGTNLTTVEAREYDGGGSGDGNLTKVTSYPNGSTGIRTVSKYYDWRDRLAAYHEGNISDASDHSRPTTVYDLDNLGEVTAVRKYDGDSSTSLGIVTTDGVPDVPTGSTAAGQLYAKSTMSYDNQGRVYSSGLFSVDPSSGSVSSSTLHTETYYDPRGNVIETIAPGGLVTKTVIDGAGRTTATFQTDGASGSSNSAASSATSDHVVEQYEYVYDALGNVKETIDRQRFDTDTGTGALGSGSTTAARSYYVGNYYDLANRLIESANYGANSGSAPTLPSSPPSGSSSLLVTAYGYDDANQTVTTTDPRSIVSKSVSDKLGRTTKTIANYVDGMPSAADDQTMEYTYDGDDHVLTMRAANVEGSTTTHQRTTYVYGVNTGTGTGGGSTLFSNDLLSAVQYPSKTTDDTSDSTHPETFTYDTLGERTKYTDRNGSVHTYTYDDLGRLKKDDVTTLGTGVDDSIRSLRYTFDKQGLPDLFGSYATVSTSDTSPSNQVERLYNGLGQLTNEYQAHSGAVNTSTTKLVQYNYSTLDSSNRSRLIAMIYPNLREVDYSYGPAVRLGGTHYIDDDISRLTLLIDPYLGTGLGTDTYLEQYTYLGLSTVVTRAHSEPGVDLTYVDSSTTGAAGDHITGLDNFGRVTDQKWVGSSGVVDEYQYGYDNDGNRLYRKNTQSTTNSELYTYDNLNRLSSMTRGTLASGNTSITSPTYSQSWNLDSQGNWDGTAGVTTNGTAQTRAHNAQNQITTIGSSTPTYDGNGNTLTDGTGTGLGHTYKYDAWNRMVRADNGSYYETYNYDALGRRIYTANQQPDSPGDPNGGDNNSTGGDDNTITLSNGIDHYYSSQWQDVEDDNNGSPIFAITSQVWSPVYVDAMVERDRDSDGDSSHTLDERLYPTQDANWNVTGILNTTGTVQERFIYNSYGTRNVLSSAWSTSANTAQFNFGFQGGEYDEISNVTIFDYRFWNSDIGRWITTDPAHADSNPYIGLASNPIRAVDPYGLSPDPIDGPIDGLFQYMDGGGSWAPMSDTMIDSISRWPEVSAIKKSIQTQVQLLADGIKCNSADKSVTISGALTLSNPALMYPDPLHIVLGAHVDLTWSGTINLQVMGSFIRHNDNCTTSTCCETRASGTVTFTASKLYNLGAGPASSPWWYRYHNTIFMVLPGGPFTMSGSWSEYFSASSISCDGKRTTAVNRMIDGRPMRIS